MLCNVDADSYLKGLLMTSFFVDADSYARGHLSDLMTSFLVDADSHAEGRLMTSLLENYTADARPVYNPHSPVNVNVTFTIKKIEALVIYVHVVN